MPPDATDAIDAAWRLLREARPADEVQAFLYAHWFHDGGPEWSFPSPAAYDAATLAPDLFAGGWTVRAAGPAHLDAEGPDGRVERLAAGSFALEQPAATPAPGLRLRRLMRTARPVNGFWHLWSDGWRDAPPEAPPCVPAPPVRVPASLVRVYLPLARGREPEAARRLLHAAPPGAVWAAKFLSGSHIAGRRDPALVYLPAGGEDAPWMAALLRGLGGLLGGPPVRLARAFHGGWLAPDPGDGRSYGEALCGALAAAWLGHPDDRRAFHRAAAAGLAWAAA